MSAPLTPEQVALYMTGPLLDKIAEVVRQREAPLLARLAALEVAGERLDEELQMVIADIIFASDGDPQIPESYRAARAAWRQARDGAGEGKG